MPTHHAPTYRELNDVLDQARRPSSSPVPITDAQLEGLQNRWSTMLAARLDQVLENAGFADEVADAWRTLAAEQPVLRGLLDEHAGRSAVLVEAMRGEFRNLALAAGLVGLNAPEERAVRLGREFRDRMTGVHLKLHQVA